jgi:4-hydroxy-tetrahydrodipicolinate synthase
MTAKTLQLFVPAITPFAADLSVDTAALVRFGKALIASGAHGLAPFGTTSEANSLTVAERIPALEALVEGGIPGSALIPGTGCCAAGDTIALTRHAMELGCRGALMLPPFYYKNCPEDGVFAAYAEVIEKIGDARLKVYLYHIPQMSGVPITLPLIERLLKAYPATIAGLKDSSGNWENTKAVIEAFPQIDTYSASEAMIPVNAATGGAGCISASANVNPAGIRALIDGLGSAREPELLAQVAGVRKIFESVPLIPSIKAAVAQQLGDPGLARVRPPLAPPPATAHAQIAEGVRIAATALEAVQ